MLKKLQKRLAELEEQLHQAAKTAPKWALCPISKEIMRNAVVVGGYSYEKEALLQRAKACEEKGLPITHPDTGEEIDIQNTNPNVALREAINSQYSYLFKEIDDLQKQID